MAFYFLLYSINLQISSQFTIAGYVNHKSIAPMVFNGYCNTQLFEAWVETFLIKALKPGQCVIMDNATFHKSKKTKDLIGSVEI